MRIVVIGGAGFIGSAVSRLLVGREGATVLVIDKLTPAASLASLASVQSSPRFSFRKADICDHERISALLQAFAPDAVVHAAVESDAGAEIGGAQRAVDTNFSGTWRLVDAVRNYWSGLPEGRRASFRFLSVSPADTMGEPAAATRAAADELVLAWHKTYGLPAIVVRSACAFGPFQFPDAAVPAAIIAAMGGQLVSVDGPQRDWIYVEDLAAALYSVLTKGTPGAAYTVTGRGRFAPADIARNVTRLMERHSPARVGRTARESGIMPPVAAETACLPALDSSRLVADTGWRAAETLDSALSSTVRWYLANEAWWRPLESARTATGTFGLLRIA